MAGPHISCIHLFSLAHCLFCNTPCSIPCRYNTPNSDTSTLHIPLDFLLIRLFPSLFSDSDWHLLLIDEVRRVGSLPPTGGVVYCIEKVSLFPLSLNKTSVELNIEVYYNNRIIEGALP